MEKPEQPKREKKVKKKESKNKNPKLGRGIESMYRISMNGHVQFNKIADNKSNLLISVSAIIISVLLSSFLPDMMSGERQNLQVPFAIIMLTCILTMIFAIIATIPKNTDKYIDLKNSETNYGEYLFFGNFYKMSLDEYVEGMRIFQTHDQKVYDALSQNFYILGKALAKKYLYLNIAYYIFLVGFIATMVTLAFIVY